jgi:hypothetical protein
MTSNVKNIYAAAPLVIGSLRVGALTTTPPTGPTDALDAGFVDLGYIGDGGFTKKLDRRTTQKRAFGGKVVKVLQSEFTSSIQLRLLESLNADALKAVYGSSNVTVTAATAQHGAQVAITVNAIKLPHMSWVIDTADDELDASYRIYVPDGQVFQVGDIKVVHTDTIEYDITINAFDDAGGNQMYVWTDDGVPGS